MKRESVLEILDSKRLISILRGDLKGREMDLLAALEQAGVAALEVSIVSPDFDSVLARIVSTFGSRMAIGAGTILSLEDLQRAIAAGASFIVSPDGNPEIIEATLRADLVSLPGAYTPTEIVQVQRWGADAVKLFPASSLGPKYVQAIRSPLPRLRLLPTGGVGLPDLPDYWQAGAWAVAVGSELVNPSVIQDVDFSDLETLAREFVLAAEKNIHVEL